MKEYKNLFHKRYWMIFYPFIFFIFFGWVMLFRIENYQEFLLVFPALLFLSFVILSTLAVKLILHDNRLEIKRFNYFSKEIFFDSIRIVKISFDNLNFNVAAFGASDRMLVAHLNNYARNIDEMKEIIEIIRKGNPKLVVDINWEQWKTKQILYPVT